MLALFALFPYQESTSADEDDGSDDSDNSDYSEPDDSEEAEGGSLLPHVTCCLECPPSFLIRKSRGR